MFNAVIKLQYGTCFRYIKCSQDGGMMRFGGAGRVPRLLLSRTARAMKSNPFVLLVNGNRTFFCCGFFTESFR
jgi:hypothetical protein